jgi:hypothetical protein
MPENSFPSAATGEQNGHINDLLSPSITPLNMGSYNLNNRASREQAFSAARGAARTPSAGSSSGSTRSTSQANPQALSEQRFQDLLKTAGEFFARSEQTDESAKLTAIAEIRDLMDRYGLKVQDLE